MKTALINIGTLVSGDLESPLLNADALVLEDDVIRDVGCRDSLNLEGVDSIIDVEGMTVCPGFIDPHVHPVLGDWSPRVHVIGCLSGCIQGGVTRMISQGETHVEGFADNASFSKALAVLAHKSFENFRPGGIRVHGGALILQEGLKEEDFQQLASEGVWLVAEIGGAGLARLDLVEPMVLGARARGMKVSLHFGGPSIPGSSEIGLDAVHRLAPDLVVHVNGGSTAAPLEEVEEVVKGTRLPFEIAFNGNPLVASRALAWALEKGWEHRVVLGTDSPTGGAGYSPLALLKLIVQVTSVHGVPAPKALCMATGNTASVFGLKAGKIERGLAADLVVLDRPKGSSARDALGAMEYGDVPGVAAVLTAGRPRLLRSAFTPPPEREVHVRAMPMN